MEISYYVNNRRIGNKYMLGTFKEFFKTNKVKMISLKAILLNIMWIVRKSMNNLYVLKSTENKCLFIS